MTSLLSSQYFQFFAIPIVAIILAVFVRIASRNDKYHIWRKEDFAVGIDIALAAILILVTTSLNTSTEKLPGAIVILLFSVFGLWMVSTLGCLGLVRK